MTGGRWAVGLVVLALAILLGNAGRAIVEASDRQDGDPVRPGSVEPARSGERQPESPRPAPPWPARSSRAFPRSVERGSDGPRIAIVFDDLGYSVGGLAHDLLEIPARLTFAVLPGLRHSEAFAESALAHGHDVLLHLPMEPLNAASHDPGDDALMADLDPSENIERLHGQMNGVPYFVGISNHMGSRFSAEPAAIRPVLEEIRRTRPGVFFLDSRTTPHSVIEEEARAVGLPALRNDLFLDGAGHGVRGSEIQTRELEGIARRRGRAIGIGHVAPATVHAVREAVERWQEEGIRLVGLSDLLHPDPYGGTR